MKKRTFRNKFQVFSLERYDPDTWDEVVYVSEMFENIIEKAKKIWYEKSIDVYLYERTADWIWYVHEWKDLNFKYWISKINYTDRERVWIKSAIIATFWKVEDAKLFEDISKYCDICLQQE